MARIAAALIGSLLVAACGGPHPGPPAPQGGAAAPGAASSATPAAPPGALAPAPPAPPAAAAGAAPGSTAEPAVTLPAGALYACVVDRNGERQISAIELDAQVTKVCAKSPEMGPCQYARETCRARGGRVFGAQGREITRATEAEYDRRVMRIRLQSN